MTVSVNSAAAFGWCLKALQVAIAQFASYGSTTMKYDHGALPSLHESFINTNEQQEIIIYNEGNTALHVVVVVVSSGYSFILSNGMKCHCIKWVCCLLNLIGKHVYIKKFEYLFYDVV